MSAGPSGLIHEIGRSSEARRKAQQSGLSLIEFAVVVVIIGIAIFFLLARLDTYQRAAEKMAVMQTIEQVRWGLRLAIAQDTMMGRHRSLEQIAQQNPVHWLAQPPVNYVGEFDIEQAKALQSGSWYYDTTRHYLVYVSADPALTEAYASQLIFEAEQTRPASIRLVQVAGFRR